MCRVEIPAVYDTVKKKILKAPARTEKTAIQAQYQTVKKRVMVSEPTLVKTTVTAKYADVKVRKLVSAAQAERNTTPARYETVTKTAKVADGRLEWRSVLCETNAGRGLVTDIQRALKSKGDNPGPIDGVLGSDTMNAVMKFQAASSLSSGKPTLETIRALGVQPK
ncbi:MAG: hypothetical protein ACI9W2_002303 [Gammaproteobacteria bacterium]|jgi:hypothetical protein